MRPRLLVFDTNTLISAALIKDSVNARALDKGFQIGQLAISDATFLEFIEVLFRPKFDKYITDERRYSIIGRIEQDAVRIKTKRTIKVCRDPKDNKFLEIAITAQASCIITGDSDLLVLHPFQNIPILNAREFLKHF